MISVMRAVAHSRPRRADVRLAPTRRGSAATIVRMLSAGESHVVTSAAHPRVSRYQRRATQRAHRPQRRAGFHVCFGSPANARGTQAPEPAQPSLRARRMGVDLNILHASSRSVRRVQRRMTSATFPTRVGRSQFQSSPGLCASAVDELTQEPAQPSAFLLHTIHPAT
jgi:hypothetical protein